MSYAPVMFSALLEAALEEAEGEVVLSYKTLVDHPEKRSDSLPKVKPDTAIVATERFKKETAARARAKELMSGESDFESEYVVMVSIVRPSPEGVMKSGKTVMKRMERSGRDKPWKALS